MRGLPGTQRAISRKTVRPPTPLSKIPIAPFAVEPRCELFGSFRDTRTTLPLDVVLLDLLVQIRPRRVDRLGRLRNVPAVLAQLREDERFLRFVLERLQRGKMHRACDDLRRGAEELRRQIGDV